MYDIKAVLEKEKETGDTRYRQQLIRRLEYFRNNIKIFDAFIGQETVASADWMTEQRAKESFYELYHDKEHSHIYFTVKDKEGVDQLYRYSTMEVMYTHSLIRFNAIMVDYIRPTNGFKIDYQSLAINDYLLPVRSLMMIGFEAFKCFFEHPLPSIWHRFILKPVPNTVGVYRYHVVGSNEPYSKEIAMATYFEFMKLFGDKK